MLKDLYFSTQSNLQTLIRCEKKMRGINLCPQKFKGVRLSLRVLRWNSCGCCFWTLIPSSLSGWWKNLEPWSTAPGFWGCTSQTILWIIFLLSLIHKNIWAEIFSLWKNGDSPVETRNISSMIQAATRLSSSALVDNCCRNQVLAAWLVSAASCCLQRQSGSGDLFKT